MEKQQLLYTIIYLLIADTLSQEWELYAEELMNTFPSSNWNHPEPPLLSCHPVIPPYQQLWDFSGQVWERQFNLEGERGLARISIMFDLYVLGVTNAFQLINEINVEFDGEIQQIPENYYFFQQSNYTYCNNVDQYYSLYMEFDISEKLVFNFILQIEMPNFQFSIKNFIVYIQRCGENCYKCHSYLFHCQQCLPTYNALSLSRHCQCLAPLAFTYNNICVEKCPNGFYAEKAQDGKNCRPYQWKQQIFNILDFQYIQDNYSNNYYLTNQQQDNIYRFNDKLLFSFSKLQSSSSLEIQAEFLYLGDLSFWTSINIIINSIYFDQIRYYLDSIQSTYGVITYCSNCSHYLFAKCLQIKYYFVIAIESNDIEMEIEGNFNITDPNQAWKLINVNVNEIQIQLSALPACTLIYDNECVGDCPKHSTQNGNVCEDYGSVYQNPLYIVKAFYSITQKQFLQQQGNFYFDHFPLHYYNGRLIQYIQNTTTNYKFTLYPHKKIKLFISILLIDWQTNDQFLQIRLPSQQVSYQFPPNILNLINDIQIGQGFSDYLYSNFTVEFTHFSDNFEIQFNCNSPYNAQCGFFDFFLIIDKCNHGCKECDINNNCLKIDSYFLIEQINYEQNNYQCMDGYFYKKEIQQCIQCEDGCLKCDSLPFCVVCKQNLLKISGRCYCPISKKIGECINDREMCQKKCQTCYDQWTNQCDSCNITELKIKSLASCECITGYFMNQEFECTKCSQNCLTCSDFQVCTSCTSTSNREIINKNCQCKQGYFESKDEIICQLCNNLCKQCILKTDYCIDCYIEQFRVLSNHQCICQQGYYEDQNKICQQCHSNCQSCYAYDKCSSCSVHKKLQSNKCICQLGYYENQNECQSCHYSCSKCNYSDAFNQCTECPSSRIQTNAHLDIFACKCLKGYYDIEQLECINCRSYSSVPIDHICYSNCGDLIVQWDEECDDGNQEPRDGCDQCYYQSANCEPSICKSCLRGQCSICIDGYYLIHDQCEQCSQNCISCEGKKNICTKCRFENEDSTCMQCDLDKGYQIVQNICVNVCGDHLKVQNEECDDGNAINGDGCNQYCQIENGFICNNECELINPIFMIVSTNSSDKYYENVRNFKLEFNQQVKIDGNLIDLVDLQLLNSNMSASFNKSVQGEQELLIRIEFVDSISNPLIQLSIIQQQNITNIQGINLSNNTKQITLISYIKQSENTIATVQSSIGFANYIIYILIGLAAFSFLTGGLNIFFNLLDTLQTLAYLKYFNLLYPFNVNMYFSIFGFAEFDFLKEYISVNFQFFDFNSLEQNPPDQKFVDEGYSSLFLLNILSVVTVFGTTLGIFMFSKLLYKSSDWILQNLSNQISKDIYYTVSKFTYYLYQSIKYIRKQCGEANQQLKNSLILTFMAATMDLNMAIFLQLKSYSDAVLISYLLSFIFFILELFFIYNCYNIVQKPKYEIITTKHISQYLALQEGIKQYSPVIKIYQLVNLMKKVMFMFCLIFFYSEPYIQVGTVSLLDIAFIGYITICNPLEDKIEYQKVLISEIILWLEQLLVILMTYIRDTSINEMLGWVLIGLSSLLLILQLIIDVKQHFSFLYQQYRVLQNVVAFVSKIFQNNEEITENLVEIPIQQRSIQTFNLSRNYY